VYNYESRSQNIAFIFPQFQNNTRHVTVSNYGREDDGSNSDSQYEEIHSFDMSETGITDNHSENDHGSKLTKVCSGRSGSPSYERSRRRRKERIRFSSSMDDGFPKVEKEFQENIFKELDEIWKGEEDELRDRLLGNYSTDIEGSVEGMKTISIGNISSSSSSDFDTAIVVPVQKGPGSLFRAIAKMIYDDESCHQRVREELIEWEETYLLKNSTKYLGLESSVAETIHRNWIDRIVFDLKKRNWPNPIPKPFSQESVHTHVDWLKRKDSSPLAYGPAISGHNGGIPGMFGEEGTFLEVIATSYLYNTDVHVFHKSLFGPVQSMYSITNRQLRSIGMLYKEDGNWDAVIPNMPKNVFDPSKPTIPFIPKARRNFTHPCVLEDFDTDDGVPGKEYNFVNIKNETIACSTCGYVRKYANQSEPHQGDKIVQCSSCGSFEKHSAPQSLLSLYKSMPGWKQREEEEALGRALGDLHVHGS